jgi:hypothetical protein
MEPVHHPRQPALGLRRIEDIGTPDLDVIDQRAAERVGLGEEPERPLARGIAWRVELGGIGAGNAILRSKRCGDQQEGDEEEPAAQNQLQSGAAES